MNDWWQEFFLSGAYTVLENLPADLTGLQAQFALKQLPLTPGLSVVDIACGVGRHSVALAKLGMNVTGLDFTPRYLELACEQAQKMPEENRPRFVRGDMRALPFADGAFDSGVSFFNSFGYFDNEADDEQALREAARVLRSGAPFLLDVLHRDGIVRRFEEKRREPFGDNEVQEERWWDCVAGRIHSRWDCILPSGETKTLTTSNRVCSFGEIQRLLQEAGFDVVNVWGDWYAQPLTLDHDSQIIAARKR
jgi:ubiquinone/menaquinone biosynthesis C-methylase UbiE